jgi:hypothetical protein
MGIPIEEYSGSGETKKLREDLKKYQDDNNWKTNLIIMLTIIGIIIGVIQVFR